MTKELRLIEPMVLEETKSIKDHICDADHRQRQLGMRDAMAVIGGKWKIQIIGTLTIKGKLRFKDLQRQVEGIGAKMLSKELHDLEANQIVTRTVQQTRPITVEYAITDYGLTLEPLILRIVQWGMDHREKIMKSPSEV